MSFFKRKTGPRSAVASTAPDPRFREFAKRHPAMHSITGWTTWKVLRSPEVPLEGGVAEICYEVREPTGTRPFLAIMRRPDGSVEYALSASHPSGPQGPWYTEALDAAGGTSRHGPMPPLDVETWTNMARGSIFSILARREGLSTQQRVRSSVTAFSEFARSGMAPQVSSWVVDRSTDDREVACGGGRIELWTGAVASDPFVYPHLAAAYRADGSIAAIAAAETMPDFHGDCFFCLFDSRGHTNLGKEGNWSDRETFWREAVGTLSALLLSSGIKQPRSSQLPREEDRSTCSVCGDSFREETYTRCELCGAGLHLRCSTQHRH